MVIVRKTPPSLIYSVWHTIREISAGNSISFNEIVTELSRLHKKSDNFIKKLLANMVYDKILIESKKADQSKKFYYTIPDLDTLEEILNNSETTHDYYCYECHLPGDNLINCIECYRVFHRQCAKQYLNQPPFLLKIPVPDYIEEAFFQIYSFSYSSYNSTNPSDYEKNEQDSNDPMACTSGYLTSNYFELFSNESVLSEQTRNNCTALNEIDCEKNLLRVCSRCRLLKNLFYDSTITQNRNTINHLLTLVFDRCKSWIADDTFSPQEDSSVIIVDSDLNFLKKLLFHQTVTIELITKKLNDDVYQTITEFVTDLFDMNHCIGILRGNNSPEYEASKYLVLDVLRDITEIQICVDCYRNSSNHDNFFTELCEKPHELVFAKQTGFPYWPAKVIRKIHNKYDVRFFGGKHPRAMIDQRNVKSIDINLKTLKIKQTGSYKSALQEMKIYQEAMEKAKKNEIATLLDKTIIVIDKILPTNLDNNVVKNIENMKRKRSTSNSSDINFNIHLKQKKIENQVNVNDENYLELPSIEFITHGANDVQEIDMEKEIDVEKEIDDEAEIDKENEIEEANIIAEEEEYIVTSSTPNKCHLLENDFERFEVVDSLRSKLADIKSIQKIREIAVETLNCEIFKWQNRIQVLEDKHKKEIYSLKNKK